MARYFLASYNYAYWSGDVGPLNDVSEPDCLFCSSAVSDVENESTNGQHERGGELRADAASSLELRPGAEYNTQFTITQAPSVVVDRTGATVRSHPGGRLTIGVLLTFRDGTWHVTEVSTGKLHS